MGGQCNEMDSKLAKGRKQRVTVEGKIATLAAVHIRVPEGPVMGPLLFQIYINESEDSVTSNIIKFADDTNIFSIIFSV